MRRVPPALVIKAVTALRGLLLRTADRLLPAPLAAAELGHQFARAHILATLSELGVADALGDERLTSAQLAGRVDCDPATLHRLLRAAATFGAVKMASDGTVRASRLTRVLHCDDVHAVGDWCRYLSSSAHQQAWADLATSVRTGQPAFRRVHGQSLFDRFAAHPDESDHFNRGLAGLTLADAPFVIAALDPPYQGVVCDIAGGRGVLLAEILHARPELRGILVESEGVLAESKAYLGERGLLDRVELVAGDMFAPLDVTADLYLLKWILHDWDDATCVRLLKGVAATMPEGARLAVVEGIQDRSVVDPRFSMIDLEMLVVTEDGRERSADELRALLTDAGLAPGGVRVTATGTAVLSACR
ncbi:MAG: O-methyltransferase [Frankiales bacterium]|nr:O-methyltransferase [Frankiales bacterium]